MSGNSNAYGIAIASCVYIIQSHQIIVKIHPIGKLLLFPLSNYASYPHILCIFFFFVLASIECHGWNEREFLAKAQLSNAAAS